MKTHEFEAMGTTWWMTSDTPDAHPAAEAFVRDVERRLSRFRSDSALTRLNRERTARDAVLASVTVEAMRFAELTGGAFDPMLGGRLAELGYDRTFESVGPRLKKTVAERPSPSTGSKVDVDGDRVTLNGPGKLDLGGIAKGWTVDRVGDLLEDLGATAWLVDGGGDLLGAGAPWPVGLANGEVVELDGLAVATSSTTRRRWRGGDGRPLHHIVDPDTGWSAASSLDTAVLVAADAVTADAFATALLVDPAILAVACDGSRRVVVRDVEGQWWTSGAEERAA